MTPERRRAHERLEALGVQWHIPSAPISLVLDAYEEVEHVRPVVDLARAVVHANSGEARAKALEALLGAVDRFDVTHRGKR